MNEQMSAEDKGQQRFASSLLEVLIRAGLLLVLALLCWQVFSPFVALMV